MCRSLFLRIFMNWSGKFMSDKILASLVILLLLGSCAPDDEQGKNGGKSPVQAEATAQAREERTRPAADEGIAASGKSQEDAQKITVANEKAREGRSENKSEAAAIAPQKTQPAKEPVSQAEYEKADRILAFANEARGMLEKKFSRPAAHMRDNIQSYMDTWHLSAMPRLNDRKAAMKKMKPDSGLFSLAEEQKLDEALQGMDKALNEMTGHYRELEKYGADSRIRDDGNKGKELGTLASESYGRFAANQHSWLEIVEKAAEDAEEKFLRSHPLQRQIEGARSIFAQFREIASIINAGGANMATLANLRQSIEEIAAECAKPPFNASPGLERLYRHFLAEVNAYCKTLNQAMAEGMRGKQMRELNAALDNCRQAYNEFASQANFLTGHSPVS